tara:strand:+ start:27639 stop:27770 length:132 start_codon:yes stop_codon:yes gene_type:complete
MSCHKFAVCIAKIRKGIEKVENKKIRSPIKLRIKDPTVVLVWL